MQTKPDPLDQMKAYLGGYIEHERKTRAGAGRAPCVPSLTVSRQAGCRGERIVPLLTQFLREHDDSSPHGWAYFDQQLVDRVLADHALPDSIRDYMPEDAKSPLAGAIEELLALHPSEWNLFQITADTVRKLCRMGGAVVVGRGGNLLTADLPNTFHARLVGSEEARRRYVEERDGIGAAEALSRVRETDRARARFVKQHLDRDVAEPAAYHMVLNTDQLRDELAAELLGRTLLRWSAAAEAGLQRPAPPAP